MEEEKVPYSSRRTKRNSLKEKKLLEENNLNLITKGVTKYDIS